MIFYVEVNEFKDGENSEQRGLFGVDNRGNLAYIGSSVLHRPLEALFSNTKSFFALEREGKETKRIEIKVSEKDQWLNEFRRQVPTPFWGGTMKTDNGELDALTSLWKERKPDNVDSIVRF